MRELTPDTVEIGATIGGVELAFIRHNNDYLHLHQPPPLSTHLLPPFYSPLLICFALHTSTPLFLVIHNLTYPDIPCFMYAAKMELKGEGSSSSRNGTVESELIFDGLLLQAFMNADEKISFGTSTEK